MPDDLGKKGPTDKKWVNVNESKEVSCESKEVSWWTSALLTMVPDAVHRAHVEPGSDEGGFASAWRSNHANARAMLAQLVNATKQSPAHHRAMQARTG
jgi:hypothetical protein